MSRGNKAPKECEGQMSIFDFCSDTSHYVVQSNKIIEGKQSLSIKGAKLIRATIMQSVRDDEDLKPYVIRIDELSSLLGISRTNLYRDIDAITDEIVQNPLFVKEIRGDKKKKISWVKIPWVTLCRYDSDVGVMIQLNEALKPYLIGLRNKYTQYTFDNILHMKSIYSLRIFEMLQNKIYFKCIPLEGVEVELTLDEIRCGCDCEDKYKQYIHLRDRVIERAVNEINETTFYQVTYTPLKKGKAIDRILFHVNVFYHTGAVVEMVK